jgi:hypothetical protein
VHLTATDDAGNTAEKSFILEVADTTAPTIKSFSGDTTLNADSACQAVVPDYTDLISVSDNCYSGLDVSQDPAAGTKISGSNNEIVVSVNDDAGNRAETRYTATVVDSMNPVLTCPEDQLIEIAREDSVYVVQGNEFDPLSSSDNCGVKSVTNDYNNATTLNGAEFPADTTKVVWTVEDMAGNKAKCSFNVTVTKPTGIRNINDHEITLYPNPVGNKLHYKAENMVIDGFRIANLTGKTLITKEEIPNQGTIDISQLRSGVYIVRIQSDRGMFTSKIIKQ